MHSDHNLHCNAAICRWQWGSMGLHGADGACMCAVALLFSFIPTDSSTTPSPWWFPDLKPPFHHHLNSLTQGVWPSVVFLLDPQMFYSSLSLSLSLSTPSPRSFALLRNNDLWIVIFIIKQCSRMLAATWFIPRFCWDHTTDACQYVWEKRRWSFGLKKHNVIQETGYQKFNMYIFILRCEFDYGGKSQIMIKQSH